MVRTLRRRGRLTMDRSAALIRLLAEDQAEDRAVLAGEPAYVALRERDRAVQARLQVEADARARAELDATRAELYVSELQRLRASRIVDALQEAMLPQELPIVDGFEIERARIERDLHDGAQQYLVAASMKVGEAALALEQVTTAHPDDRAAKTAAELIGQAQDDADAALHALRETVAGVHSRLLAEQGLEPALRELAARFDGPGREVTLRIPHRLPDLPP